MATTPKKQETTIAEAILVFARAIDRLGLADAATRMGAIELLSLEIKHHGESVTILADAINNLAEATREASHATN
jgi:hemoglobin-like flavoprotein